MIGDIRQLQIGNCFSYLLIVEDEIIIIDPHLNLLADYQKEIEGKKLVAVIDTHTHADHISCARILSQENDAPLLMSKNAISALPLKRLVDDEKVVLANTKLEVMLTQGHTDDSLSIVWQGHVFTGDTLLINSIGRCDFQNGSPRDMFFSLQNLKTLPAETIVYPSHDYNKLTSSTIADELENNRFLQIDDVELFIETVTAKELPKPADFDNIVSLNQSGEAGQVKKIVANKVAELIEDEDWLLLDVRSAEECASMGIEAAINISLPQIPDRINEIPKGKNIILTCKTGSRAMRAAMILMEKGYANLYLLDGAILAWKGAGLPVLKNGPIIPLQQQIQLIAGSMVTIGIVAAYFLSPLFILISLMAGLGLMLAGFTGLCPMGELLLRAPWNKIKPTKSSTSGGCSASGGGGCSL